MKNVLALLAALVLVPPGRASSAEPRSAARLAVPLLLALALRLPAADRDRSLFGDIVFE
jgi:hypothetical protein